MSEPAQPRAYHVAFEDDWEQSLGFGSYEAATRGHPYEPGDFIRATTADGIQAVLDGHYQDLNITLLLIGINTAALEATGTRVERDAHDVRIFGPLDTTDQTVIFGVFPVTHEHERWVAPESLVP